MLVCKVNNTIKKYSLFAPDDRIVVAVSGGPDSVCLLSVLLDTANELGITLHVAHLDHQLRGKESENEARFVEELAKKMGIPATIDRRDVNRYCAERGIPTQAGAREVRYAFLEEVRSLVGAQYIATGHTADDQAETLLMRLMRGAGLSGLSGIPPKREHIIRPLIETTRKEILAYLKDKNLQFVTDSSNLRPVYTRNRLRMEILPVLAGFNPRIVETLSAEAEILRDENEALDAYTAFLSESIIEQKINMARINRDKFNKLPRGFRRRIFRTAFSRIAAAETGLSSIQTENAVKFMEEVQTGRAMELPFGIVLEREYDMFILHQRASAIEFCVPLAVPGETILPQLSLVVEAQISAVCSKAKECESDENLVWQTALDYDKITPPLFFRNRRPGDRIRPTGMGGRSKKLHDLFIDMKLPRQERQRIPILADNQDVLWIPGIRTDERFIAGSGTKKRLLIRVRKNELAARISY